MDKEEIVFKRAGLDDLDKILELEKGLAGTKIYSALTDREDAVKQIKSDIFYLIELDGEVVGDISYELQGDTHAYISGLAIKPEFQGQGIARKAIEKVLDELKGIKTIDLITHPENEKAINLSRSLGFKETGEVMENYSGDGEPRIKMVLRK